MATLATFWLLVIAGAARAGRRAAYRAKPMADWVLDLSGLAVQGLAIPLLATGAIAVWLRAGLPAWAGVVELPGNGLVAGFLLNFIAVDYLYYWNHRLLHTRRLWPVHAVHHTVTEMDVLGTSRNTLWSSFLILYLWGNGAAVYLLAEPAGYLAGATLTAMLDLWRHSELHPRGAAARVLGAALVLPGDHAWHHADGARGGNYGANFSVWDRVHGTLLRPGHAPARLGVEAPMSLPRKLLWPFS